MNTNEKGKNDRDSSGDLFSGGIVGLLEKGPIGWILFGLIAGALSGIYKAIAG